jgi:hypothetical protein
VTRDGLNRLLAVLDRQPETSLAFEGGGDKATVLATLTQNPKYLLDEHALRAALARHHGIPYPETLGVARQAMADRSWLGTAASLPHPVWILDHLHNPPEDEVADPSRPGDGHVRIISVVARFPDHRLSVFSWVGHEGGGSPSVGILCPVWLMLDRIGVRILNKDKIPPPLHPVLDDLFPTTIFGVMLALQALVSPAVRLIPVPAAGRFDPATYREIRYGAEPAPPGVTRQ